ncbi:MAG: pilus assembly protein PilP [Gammaproteobacteria bacterium]|nr:pilus assembly protein PilP [Gammaproteobacteria bacterium]
MKDHAAMHLFWPLLALIAVGGCVSKDKSDLQQYVDEVLKRPGGRIDPLPEIRPYEAYAYKAADAGARDPFQAFYVQTEQDAKDIAGTSGLTKELEQEIKNRNREELEQFELDSLRMVGTIADPDDNWGIIKDPSGVVHRVKVGNYIGRNIGKIVNIFEDKIELREIVQNTQGRWEERPAALALIE